MSAAERVKNLVIGGGEAGKYIAWELAAKGERVVVIERELVGGSCPNIACLPSKNVIRSAEVAHLARHASEYGVDSGDVRVDMTAVRGRKRTMVKGLIATHEKRFDHENIEFIMADGHLSSRERAGEGAGSHIVEARAADGATRHFETERMFLNLGTRPAVPDIPGLVDAAPLTHVEALELGHVPEHLIVLGGGYVGVEFAQAYRRFGSDVTIVQRGEGLLSREDTDVQTAVQDILEADGIRVMTSCEATMAEGRSGARVRAHVTGPHGQEIIDGTDLLVATGREPNTRGIGLEEVGIELDERGYVRVDDRLQTSAAGAWAMGDCAGSPQFTHVAFDDFRVVRDGLAGKDRTTTERLVPHAVFINPELARIGLDESEAARRDVPVRVARLPLAAVLRARSLGETTGFMKMLLASDSDRILGFTMLGHGASEVVAVVQMAMLAGLPFTTVRDAVLTHPTMAEGLTVLLANEPPVGD